MLTRILNSYWDLARWFHLIIGLLLIYVAVHSADYMAGLLGFFFAGKALLNVDCCASTNCEMGREYSSHETTEDVVFEEIKTK
ncbi:MAG: hypothetical protein ACXVNR_04335 [Bacteroidia bacterium]